MPPKVRKEQVIALGNFNPEEVRDRFAVEVHSLEESNGFVAVVRRKGERVSWAYKSDLEYGKRGIFPNASGAETHGRRWIEAEVRRQFRVEQLRLERSAKLPAKLTDLMAEREECKRTAKDANSRAKEIETISGRLTHEANSPQVALEFAPSGDDFQLFDCPAWTDGTQDEDGRQVSLDLDATVDGAKDPEPKPQRRGKGKRKPPRSEEIRRGAKDSHPSDMAWPDEDPEGNEGEPSRPGLDPSAVKWPTKSELEYRDDEEVKGGFWVNGIGLHLFEGDALDRWARENEAPRRGGEEDDPAYCARLIAWVRNRGTAANTEDVDWTEDPEPPEDEDEEDEDDAE